MVTILLVLIIAIMIAIIESIELTLQGILNILAKNSLNTVHSGLFHFYQLLVHCAQYN